MSDDYEGYLNNIVKVLTEILAEIKKLRKQLSELPQELDRS
jgi:cell division septum initiation protein DivIVA